MLIILIKVWLQVQRVENMGLFLMTRKRNISKLNDGHIFNSGPLMDDVGDGSDYEDYFGRGIGIGGSRQIETED
jgi:hypothetical protein